MNTDTNFENKFNPRNNLPQYGGEVIQFNPEDIKIAKDCYKEGFVKVGVPFAIGFHFCYSYLCKIGIFNTPTVLGKIVAFPLNIIFGTYLFYGKTCVNRFKNHMETKKLLESQDQSLLLSGQNVSLSRPSEPAFDTTPDTKLIDSDSYFSPVNLDYDSFRAPDVENENKKIKETTYDELRQQNRENYQRQLYNRSLQRSSAFDLRSSNEPAFENTTKEAELKSSKIKNKYGDELEL